MLNITAKSKEDYTPSGGQQNAWASKAGHKVRELVDTTAHEARNVTVTVRQQIRKNPVKAGAIATGIGFLLGALFFRR